MMDKDIERQQQLESRFARPTAQVIVIEEPQPEALIEAADLLRHLAANKHTEPGQPIDPLRLVPELTPPPGGEFVQSGQLLVIHTNLLRRRREVRDRPRQPG